MEAITDLLSPEQIDTILSVYGTLEAWVALAVDNCSVVIEDIFP